MHGFTKVRRRKLFGRNFPFSQYDSPFGRRPTALDLNVMRYRSIEVTLYLFYAEEVRNLILANMTPKLFELSGREDD